MNIEYLIINLVGISILTLTLVWYFTHIFVGTWDRVKRKFDHYMNPKNTKDFIVFWIITVALFITLDFELLALAALVDKFVR